MQVSTELFRQFGAIFSNQQNKTNGQGERINGQVKKIIDLTNRLEGQGAHLESHAKILTGHEQNLRRHESSIQFLKMHLGGSETYKCTGTIGTALCLSGVGLGILAYALKTDCSDSSGVLQHVKCYGHYVLLSEASISDCMVTILPWMAAALGALCVAYSMFGIADSKSTREINAVAALTQAEIKAAKAEQEVAKAVQKLINAEAKAAANQEKIESAAKAAAKAAQKLIDAEAKVAANQKKIEAAAKAAADAAAKAAQKLIDDEAKAAANQKKLEDAAKVAAEAKRTQDNLQTKLNMMDECQNKMNERINQLQSRKKCIIL